MTFCFHDVTPSVAAIIVQILRNWWSCPRSLSWKISPCTIFILGVVLLLSSQDTKILFTAIFHNLRWLDVMLLNTCLPWGSPSCPRTPMRETSGLGYLLCECVFPQLESMLYLRFWTAWLSHKSDSLLQKMLMLKRWLRNVHTIVHACMLSCTWCITYETCFRCFTILLQCGHVSIDRCVLTGSIELIETVDCIDRLHR